MAMQLPKTVAQYKAANVLLGCPKTISNNPIIVGQDLNLLSTECNVPILLVLICSSVMFPRIFFNIIT